MDINEQLFIALDKLEKRRNEIISLCFGYLIRDINELLSKLLQSAIVNAEQLEESMKEVVDNFKGLLTIQNKNEENEINKSRLKTIKLQSNIFHQSLGAGPKAYRNGITVLETGLSDHKMITLKLGKKRPDTTLVRRQVITNEQLKGWESTPRSFVEMDLDIFLVAEEIRLVQCMAYETKKKLCKSTSSWYGMQQLVELRRKIKNATANDKRKLQNKYINSCRRAKIIAQNEGNQVNVWARIKKTKDRITLLKDDECVDDPLSVATLFQQKFSNTTTPVNDACLAEAVSEHERLIAKQTSWKFKFVTPNEVKEIIDSWPNKRTEGPDGIAVGFLKKLANGVSNNLAQLINMIISRKSYPQALARARIIPCYKRTGLKSNIDNYRPICIKGSLAKVVDKVLFGRQMSLEVDKHMTGNIYGYRTSLGTQDAVINVREKIIESIALNKKVALISWDIRGGGAPSTKYHTL